MNRPAMSPATRRIIAAVALALSAIGAANARQELAALGWSVQDNLATAR